VNCPECGTEGKKDGSSQFLSHVETPGHCHTYTWDRFGRTVARDHNSKDERARQADAFDARLRALNPFRRG
jgi:YD repeat-containing protein